LRRDLPEKSGSKPASFAEFRHEATQLRSEIAERKDVEIELRRLAGIVESSDDAILSKTLEGIILTWNNGAEHIFGYKADEIIGQSVTILIPRERHDEEPRILDRIRRGERIDHYETVRQRKDGSLVDISLTVSPIKDAEGRVIAASKIARDITDRKRAERELHEARNQLARANEDLQRRVEERTASLQEALSQLEEFSHTVSHDLRAPLRGMQIYSTALLEDFGLNLPPEATHYLKKISHNAALLDKMILDVLTFSRVSRGELQWEMVSLDKLVAGIIEHSPAMQPPNAEIQVEPLLPVHGHAPSLSQAVSNLLTNAVKFVPPGMQPIVRVWTEARGEDVRLWVQDNGIGIDPQYHHRLFNMFERIHPKLAYEGTGVGLAIAAKAVQRMNGQIGVESDGAHGSRFWIQVRGAMKTPHK
jgi:PAS domain S-box-containing protein